MHRYMEGIMKKLSALVLASLPLFILSCGFWNYEAPETFSVKTTNTTFTLEHSTHVTISQRKTSLIPFPLVMTLEKTSSRSTTTTMEPRKTKR